MYNYRDYDSTKILIKYLCGFIYPPRAIELARKEK